MKKLLPFAIIVLLFSCKKNLLIDTENTKTNRNKGNAQITSAGHGVWDLLGYGYDATGQYAHSSSATLPIIDVVKLRNEHPTYVDSSGAESTTSIFISGQNAREFSDSLSGRLNLNIGKALPFTATINANFNSSNNWSSKYVYSTYSNVTIKKSVKFVNDIDLLKNYLHVGFVNHLNTKSPQELVDFYGTHILTNIALGGKVELIYKAQTNSQNRKIAAGAGAKFSFLKIFNTDISGSYNSSEASSNFDESAYVRTVGGNSTAAIASNITFDQNGTPSATFNISGWAAGLTDTNAEMVDIYPKGLIPIYSLIADSAKKAAVQSYVQAYLQNSSTPTYDEPSTVYLFQNTSVQDYVFGFDPTWQYTGFQNSGPAFKAFTYKAPGTVQVYQFRNDVNRDHAYYTAPYLNYANWILDGGSFYAYDSQKSGTVPVYQFYNAKNKCHLFHVNRYVTSGYSGWEYQGIVFYVLPN